MPSEAEPTIHTSLLLTAVTAWKLLTVPYMAVG